MKIIGHRGAAGLALENTMQSFRLALDLKVDGIELDVRVTSDGKVVVSHDGALDRVSGSHKLIRDTTYAEIKKIPLFNGERMPLLSDVLQIAGSTPVVVEIKVTGYTKQICKVFDSFPEANVIIASTYDVLAEVKKLRPDLPILLREHFTSMRVLALGRRLHAGIDLNHRLLSPLTYWAVMRHSNLQLMIYTIDSPIEGWIIRKFYPRVWLCTNHPERFVEARVLDMKNET